jgi:hypothetical protein
MTVKELKEVALEIPGVTGVTAMKKGDLIDIIKKDRGIVDEKKPTKPIATVKEMKKKIVQFRLAKQEARKEKNRKKVDILRRRINRLKKQTRKVAQG